MNRRTPLYAAHIAAGARMVPFGGWEMPLHYGSQLEEHHAVRRSWGVFDVSHMTVVDLAGTGCVAVLSRLLANDIGKLSSPGRGLYSCMLNASGGVVDDLIVYRTAEDAWRLVMNAATREQDLAWLSRVAGDSGIEVVEQVGQVMLAVQGPLAMTNAAACLPGGLRDRLGALRPFACVGDDGVFVARTGYTGEDGFEIVMGPDAGTALWHSLLQAGAAPCGLGARDTLRLEAGLPLYGQDMDADTSPLVAGLGWTVAFEPPGRAFIGREPLEKERAGGVATRLAGLVLEDRGIMRHGQRVITAAGNGIVTSGGFSPTMDRSIALARVPATATGPVQVEIRSSLRAARLVKPPFVRHGQVSSAVQAEPPGRNQQSSGNGE